MKNNIFKKSILALAIPAALMSVSVTAAPTFEQADLQQTQEARLAKTSFIIKFKAPDNAALSDGMPAVESKAFLSSMTSNFTAVSGHDFTHLRPMALSGHHVFSVDSRLTEKQTQRVMELLARDSSVEFVEENKLMQAFATPNDSSYNNMWHYFESTGGLNVPTAWDSVTGSGVTVAVLDTGYRPHSDLAGNLVGGYDMVSDSFIGNDGNGRDSDARDPGDAISANECGYAHSAQSSSWHGTHVAGTVAAVGNNNSGIIGVAYGAKVVPVRVLGKCGGTTADIADAIIWASGGSVSGVPSNANPADVINLSLGGGGSCGSTTQSAINTARGNGAVVVVAAGNSNANVSGFTPANCSGVVSVAATNRNGGRSYYSNYGSLIDVAAPGGAQSFANDPNGILSTHNTGSNGPGSDTLTYMQGTSMAAPHVAGVAALIKQAKPSATPDEIESILKNTTRSFPATCSSCGTGIVDAKAAVDSAAGGSGGSGGSDSGTTSNISKSQGQWHRESVNLPSGVGSFNADISGGSGDADLYVNQGTAPTTSSYDCRPYRYGNVESCTINSPAAGDMHIGIRAYSAFSGVTLNWSYN